MSSDANSSSIGGSGPIIAQRIKEGKRQNQRMRREIEPALVNIARDLIGKLTRRVV